MKIVCGSCGAKYSIADEKVKGKVFKIRCKKCGESIVVKGDAPEQASEPASSPAAESAPGPAMFPPPMPSTLEVDDETEAETRVFDYSGYQQAGDDEAVWHIVVEGQEQGPYTEAQILEYLDAGSLDLETLIWREGFEDWIPINNVPELSGGGQPAAPMAAAEPAVPQGTGPDLFNAQPQSAGIFEQPSGGGGLFDGGSEMSSTEDSVSPFDTGAGLFGSVDGEAGAKEDILSSAPSGPSTGGMFSADTAFEGGEAASGGIFADAGGGADIDVFGDAAAGGAADGLFSTSEEPDLDPRIDAASMMTGQRSENSVLFSLSNLQSLAASPQTAGPQGTSPQAASPHVEFSLGSGAEPTSGEEASGLIDIRSLAGSISSDKDNTGGVDDILSMGGGGFGPSLGAPVLTPQQESMGLGAKIGIAMGSVAALAVIVVLLVVAMSKGEDEMANKQIALLQDQLEKIQKAGPGTIKLDAVKAAKIAEVQAASKAQPKAASDHAAAANDANNATQPDGEKKETGSSKSSRSRSRGSSSKSRGSTSKSSSSKSPSPASSPSKDSASLDNSLFKKSSSSSSSPEKTPPASKSGGSDALDDLLGGSLAKPKKKPPKSKSSSSSSAEDNVKKNLDRSDVQKGMNSVAGRIKQCGQGQRGTVTLKIVVGRTGRVISVNATGPFAGTPVGSCAARAARAARFPKTQNNLTVRYPFKL